MSARLTGASKAQGNQVQRTRRGQSRADHALYDACKAAWIAQHPGSTPEQYQEAMRRLARECGV